MTNQKNQDEYILVISAQLRQRVWLGKYFDNSETHWVLHKVLRKLLSQNTAKFEDFLMNDDFDALQRTEFYKSQEIL